GPAIASRLPRSSGTHGGPTCPILDADQPLLHLRGPDARLQGRPLRHAVRPVPRQDGIDQGHGPGLCPDPDVGGQAGDVVRHPRFPGAAETEPDLLSVEQQGLAGDRRRVGPSGPRRTRVAVRRDEDPAGPAERPRTMGVRGDADPGPRALACPGDAAGRVPRGHEQAPRDGRPDARAPGLAPRGTESRRLRRLRLAVAREPSPTGTMYASRGRGGSIVRSASADMTRRSNPRANPVCATASPPKTSASRYAPPPPTCFSAPRFGESISKTIPV